MRYAPWTDCAGHRIYEGEEIIHPAGARGVVRFMPEYRDAENQWRVDYGDGFPSRLTLNISLGIRQLYKSRNSGLGLVPPRI